MADERIQISLVNDDLEARASVVPGPAVGMPELRAALEQAGICHGVVEAACTQLAEQLANPEFNVQNELVASGEPPEPGEDSRIELFFRVGIQPGTLREDGTLEFRERELLKPVEEGDLIARRHAPTAGIPGRSVTGKEIAAADGRDTGASLGGAVQLDANDEIRSAKSGVIQYQPGKFLDVVDLYEHTGDVDLHSGNLEMEGTIHVTGDVARRHTVRATGDIVIGGLVDGACIYAGGSLSVASGIIGGKKGRVVVEGDLVARHLQSARVRCYGILAVQSNVTNSEIHAHELRVERRIFGGKPRAEKFISVGEAGSKLGAKTVLTVGEPIGCNEADPRARKAGKQRPRAPRPSREELLAEACVEVRGACHAGVLIVIGPARLRLMRPLHAVRFRYDTKTHQIEHEPL